MTTTLLIMMYVERVLAVSNDHRFWLFGLKSQTTTGSVPVDEQMQAEQTVENDTGNGGQQQTAVSAGHATMAVVPIDVQRIVREKTWCNLTKFVQNITRRGCETVQVVNNFCVGACFSMGVPDTAHKQLTICSYCAPTTHTLATVRLKCSEKRTHILKVNIVRSCECIGCKFHNF